MYYAPSRQPGWGKAPTQQSKRGLDRYHGVQYQAIDPVLRQARRMGPAVAGDARDGAEARLRSEGEIAAQERVEIFHSDRLEIDQQGMRTTGRDATTSALTNKEQA